MSPETVAALHRINLQFYRRHAASFSATRERPWPAWERVAGLVEERDGEGPWSVLDLGCGNGRLGRFLETRWGRRLRYLGIDASEPMLEIARGMGGGEFRCRDLIRQGLPAELPGSPFQLVTAFGLMHHLPGFASRAALLRGGAQLLAPGGLLAVSFWQFGERRRFRRRVVPWRRYNRAAAEPIDTGELEKGDVLLAWGEESTGGGRMPPVRFCHWTRPAEVERLSSALSLRPVDEFRADGRGGKLNLYRILVAAD